VLGAGPILELKIGLKRTAATDGHLANRCTVCSGTFSPRPGPHGRGWPVPRIFPGYPAWPGALKIDLLHEGTTVLELWFEFSPDLGQTIRNELVGKGRRTPIFEYGYFLAQVA